MKRTATPLRPLRLPPHERHVLSNGLTVHVVRRGPLPLVAVRLTVRGGSAADPASIPGLADFGARLLRRGAAGRGADEISEAVDFVGAALGGYATEESVVVSLTTLSRHLESMVELMGQVLIAPDFPEAEVELSRRRTLAQLQNDLDDPGAIAEKAWSRAMWGSHPYGNEQRGSKRTLEAISRQSLVDFHRSSLGPSMAHLYVVGDVQVGAVVALAERVFGQWRGGPTQVAAIPPWQGPVNDGGVLIVDKPEQTQVQLRIGARGVGRGHPDHFALTVMNAVLGGGFTSRLINEIRVKRGLSYGAHSAFDMLTGAGTLLVSSFTRTERVNELIDVALGEVKKMRLKGPTPIETDTMKRYVSGLYPSRIETNDSLASVLADVEHYALPEGWVEQYRDRIGNVTAKEVAAAAHAHLFDAQRVIVLVGNAEALAPRVAKYGPVSVMQLAELE